MKIRKFVKLASISLLITASLLSNKLNIKASEFHTLASGDGYNGTISWTGTLNCPGSYTEVAEIYITDETDEDAVRTAPDPDHKPECTFSVPEEDKVYWDGKLMAYKVCWNDRNFCPYQCGRETGYSEGHRYATVVYKCNVCGDTSLTKNAKQVMNTCPYGGYHHFIQRDGYGRPTCVSCGQRASVFTGACPKTRTATVNCTFTNNVSGKLNQVGFNKKVTVDDPRVVIDYNSDVTLTYNFTYSGNYSAVQQAQWYCDNTGAKIFDTGNMGDAKIPKVSVTLKNVIQSDMRYYCKFFVAGAGWQTTDMITVDTTVLYYDYSPDDGISGNATSFKNGNLIDDYKTLDTEAGRKGVDGTPNDVIVSKALIPDVEYGALSDPTLYFRFNLYPRTVKNDKNALLNVGDDEDTTNDYKVLLPDYFKNAAYDLQDSDNESAVGTGTDLKNAFTSGTASDGAIFTKEDGTTKYKWSLYSVSDFRGWTLMERDQTWVEPAPKFGSAIISSITPDSLGVIGKHWGAASYKFHNTNIPLPEPERYMVVKLDTAGGEITNLDDLPDSTKYNDRVKSQSYTENGETIETQTTVGGTYSGLGIIPDDYDGTYLTYKYKFGGWMSSGTYIPIYHTHKGTAEEGGEGTCYKVPIAHVHTESCYVHPEHVHDGDAENGGSCYEPVYHVHDGNSVDGGDCYTIPIYHVHTGSSSTGGGCYTHPVMKWVGGTWVRTGGSYTEGDGPTRCPICNYGIDRWDSGGGYTSWSCTNGSCGHMEGQVLVLDHYDLSCGMTDTTVVGYGLSCEYVAAFGDDSQHVVGYTLSCNKKYEDELVLSCTKENDGYMCSCGMEEGTIEGYEFVPGEGTAVIKTTTSEGYLTDKANVTMYADWEETNLELPQVEKEGYRFLGWYTEPQTIQAVNGGSDGNAAVFNNANYAGSGYISGSGEIGMQKDTTFLESSVNMDNPDNCVTLYAWYNKKPVYADLYEGLFFEGQDVTYSDLLKLVAIYDYEDDYYNTVCQEIYGLPTIRNRKDMYLNIQYDSDEDEEGNPDDNDDIEEEEPTFERTGESGGIAIYDGLYFDSASWEPVLDTDTDGSYLYDLCSDANGDGIYVEGKDGAVDVYRYKGDNSDYYDEDGNGLLFYTDEALQALEAKIKSSGLKIMIKSIDYRVKDGADTSDILTIPTIASNWESTENPEDINDGTDVTTSPEPNPSGDPSEVGKSDIQLSDYTSFNEAYNTLKSTVYDKTYVDTATSRIKFADANDSKTWYGDFVVTFTVTDGGVLAGTDIQILDSPITTDYERVCRVTYNEAPVMYTDNISWFSTVNMSTEDAKQYIIDRQVSLDAQDYQTNVPWLLQDETKQIDSRLPWTKISGKEKLLSTIEVKGIYDLTVNTAFIKEVPNAVAWLNNLVETWNEDETVNSFDKFYAFKGDMTAVDVSGVTTTYDALWRATTSFAVELDCYDQFGKYASNGVTERAGLAFTNDADGDILNDGKGVVPHDDNRFYQPKEYRSSRIFIINVDSDEELVTANVKQAIRYVNTTYLDTVEGKDSYFGTTGYGLEKLKKALENVNSGTIRGTYTGKVNNTVITVNDYAEETEDRRSSTVVESLLP